MLNLVCLLLTSNTCNTCSVFTKFEHVNICWLMSNIKPLVRKQKGGSQNVCYKKSKHTHFFEKWTFLTPLIRTCACAYLEVRNVRFSENWRALLSCNTRFLRFTLLPYYRRSETCHIKRDLFWFFFHIFVIQDKILNKLKISCHITL